MSETNESRKSIFPFTLDFFFEKMARTPQVQAVIGPCIKWLIFGILYLLDGKTPNVSSIVYVIGAIVILIMSFKANGVRLNVSVRLREPLP